MKCLNCPLFFCLKCDQAHDVSHLLLKLTFEPKTKPPSFGVLRNNGIVIHFFFYQIFSLKFTFFKILCCMHVIVIAVETPFKEKDSNASIVVGICV